MANCYIVRTPLSLSRKISILLFLVIAAIVGLFKIPVIYILELVTDSQHYFWNCCDAREEWLQRLCRCDGKKQVDSTCIRITYSVARSLLNTWLATSVPSLSSTNSPPSFPDRMQKSKGGPLWEESLSMTDSCRMLVPIGLFSWKRRHTVNQTCLFGVHDVGSQYDSKICIQRLNNRFLAPWKKQSILH